MTSPRNLSRRQALAALGTVSLGGVLAACGGGDDGPAAVTTEQGATETVEPKTSTSRSTAERFDASASCSLTPAQTEGPYYFDVDAIRSDIREDRRGTPLRVALRVRDAGSCEPIENAIVDIWHCDAGGAYSGFESASSGGAGGAGGGGRTDEETYLRGAQATNAEGIVEFRTVYPGWYPGRTAHIHAKVHLDRRTLLTTQLYFEDRVSDEVYAQAPYADRGRREATNENDGGFDETTVLSLSKDDGGGYLGLLTFDVERA